MIVVLGRPSLDDAGNLAGLAGSIAAASADAGARVEVCGKIPDDADGDSLAVALGRAGVGHAALLRDPAGAARPLDAGDIELGLGYLSDCRVLVVADELSDRALAAAVAGARYHGAAIVIAQEPVSAAADGQPPSRWPDDATVLEAPDADDGAFARLVGRYAAQIDSGREPAAAWQDAITQTGWERSGDGDAGFE